MTTGPVGPKSFRPWQSTAVRLGVVAFVAFNANLRSISSADTFPSRYLPIAMLTGHGVFLDEFDFLRDARYALPGGRDENSGVPYYLQYRRGHFLSTYPVTPAILAMPVYALPVALGLVGGAATPAGYTRTEVVGTMLSKIAASAAAAASVVLVYLCLLQLGARSSAVWIALIYAFATSTWSVSSQGIWQTSFSGPLLAGAVLLLLKARESDRRRDLVGAGLCLALAVACRPTAGIFAVLYSVHVLQHHRRSFLAYAALPALLGAVLVGYNLYYFDSLLGGYTGTYVAPYVFTAGQVMLGTYGLLLSANRGMLVLSPVLLVAFVGLVRALVRRTDDLLALTAVGIIATILFYSTFTAWHGSFTFSYRYLTDLLPLVVLFIPSCWGWITAARWRRTGFGLLAAYSIGIQVVGTFFYPCGWYRSPQRDPSALERIFSWRDLEVVQCLRAGPVYPDGLRLLTGRRSERQSQALESNNGR